MCQLTIYLEDGLEERVRERAKLEGLSVSKWIAKAIEANERDVWPSHILASFGTWDDVPSLDELRRGYGQDAVREPLTAGQARARQRQQLGPFGSRGSGQVAGEDLD